MIATSDLEVQSEKDRKKFFEALYQSAFPKVAAFVRKMNGTLDDAQDVFHDALVIFYEKSVSESFECTVSDEAYLLGITKHLWIRRFNEDKGKVHLDVTENSISIPNDYFHQVDENKVMLWLESAGKKCLEMLKSFYYDRLSMEKIAARYGYTTGRSATVQKYKCIEKIRNKVKTKDIAYEDFTE